MSSGTYEYQAWDSALKQLERTSGAHMVFGGPIAGGRLRLRHFVGNRTAALRNLAVRPGAGLGGRVWQDAGVVMVDDYGAAAEITHEYDQPVGRENLQRIVGAPVLVGRRVAGVVYAGLRAPSDGDRLADSIVATVSQLARHLTIEEEVERRLAGRVSREHERDSRLLGLLADLRTLQRSSNAEVAADIAAVLEPFEDQAIEHRVLTERETHVLALVAQGATYGSVADALGLASQTVKSYMRDINIKLGVHSRHEAVIEARRRGHTL